MVVQRFERGNMFLDLNRWVTRGLDEDGFAVEDECWEAVIYKNNEIDYNDYKVIEFGSEVLARMFIEQNNWVEQVL